MTGKPAQPDQPRPRRIAIALELDHPYPWHHECYQGILDYAEAFAWHCIVDPHLVGPSGKVEVTSYDGIVGRISRHVADAAREHNIPIVNHWGNSPAKDLPTVLYDQRTGARLAGEDLVERGFRHFAYIGFARDASFHVDFEGLSDAVVAAGFQPPTAFTVKRSFETQWNAFAQFRLALQPWVAELPTPTGLLVSSNIIGRYLAQICRELGLRVPHDRAIIVQTGDYTIGTCARPTLSSVDHDYFTTGYRAAGMLDQLMRGEPVLRDRPLFIAPRRLVIRESSDTFITPNEQVTEAMRYIADHAGHALTVPQVADAMSVSRRTLERLFELHLGQSIYATITRFRIDFIKRALIDSKAPLAAVAVDCGFASVSHFTEFFRKSTNITPSRFRRQHQG